MGDWRDSYDAWKLASPYDEGGPSYESVEELKAEMEALIDENDTLRRLVKNLIDNDPNEAISDAGHTVLELWRHDARAALNLPDPNAPVEEEIAF